MSLLMVPALALLLALPLLAWFASNRKSPKRRDVGTHFIWSRLLERKDSAPQKQRSLDLLFWIIVAAIVIGTAAAARPAIIAAEGTKTMAVLVERVFDTAPEPQHESVVRRAEFLGSGADITYFVRGEIADGPLQNSGDVIVLKAATNQAALSAFMARTGNFNGRACFVLRKSSIDAHQSPRLETPLVNVITNVIPNEKTVQVNYRGTVPELKGGAVLSNESGMLRIKPNAPTVTLTSGGQVITLTKSLFGIGTGTAWTTRQHSALLKALRPDDIAPNVWLGADKQRPCIRILQGTEIDVSGAQVHMDPAHPMFEELPISRVDWLSSRKLMPAESNTIPLVRVTRNGQVLGDFVRRKGDIIEFAADPFSEWPIELAVILLDNSIAILTGQHAGSRASWEITQPTNLPATEAFSATLEQESRAMSFEASLPEVTEQSHWLAILAALACLYAALALTPSEPIK
ncbi:hypothetical protein OAU50_01285 [Planctomycetota bacterium]|nr:hypothetical protein [Planctomycetota bacterium]